jgi:hypothetical protein
MRPKNSAVGTVTVGEAFVVGFAHRLLLTTVGFEGDLG